MANKAELHGSKYQSGSLHHYQLHVIWYHLGGGLHGACNQLFQILDQNASDEMTSLWDL
jgi:hypothetical protein